MKVKILKHYGTVRAIVGTQGVSAKEDLMNSYFIFNYMAEMDGIIDYYSEDSINHDLRKVGEEFYV